MLDDEVGYLVGVLTKHNSRPPTVDDVTRFANSWLDQMSDPDRLRKRHMYGSYSTEMLVLAACRTAERL
ncbi:hypothetical protein [Plantactinospora sonchi]|uniref:Uncharacterized protein n=1 Tax=Plantactinospora sonchi TaxID=1544735 RepID=A0ABU7S676_9ACTN